VSTVKTSQVWILISIRKNSILFAGVELILNLIKLLIDTNDETPTLCWTNQSFLGRLGIDKKPVLSYLGMWFYAFKKYITYLPLSLEHLQCFVLILISRDFLYVYIRYVSIRKQRFQAKTSFVILFHNLYPDAV